MLAAVARPEAHDRREFSLMGTEKVLAFWESTYAIGMELVRMNQEYARVLMERWWKLWTTPWWFAPYRAAPSSIPPFVRLATPAVEADQRRLRRSISKVVERGLTPIHTRATANARRLSRIKKRSR
jgi:hypothetical protein